MHTRGSRNSYFACRDVQPAVLNLVYVGLGMLVSLRCGVLGWGAAMEGTEADAMRSWPM